ncbi:hypothetical protein XOCgx_2916 [Xanthomonas oryzae pv. oryzicola]|nr:hypothetical protein XOCgx_2916 [Xanthomonas oryzae pv. oryzicola]
MAQINARPTRAVHCAPNALGNAIAMALLVWQDDLNVLDPLHRGNAGMITALP